MNIKKIIGIISIVLAIFMVVVLPSKDIDTLTCDRSSQICNVKRFSWRGEEIAAIPITDLRQAEVERRRNKDRVTYLLILNTNNERFIVTYNGSISKKESIANRVNSFIANAEDTGFTE